MESGSCQMKLRDNQLRLLEEDVQNHEGIKLNPEEQQYMLPHFLMMLIGKPGSGKTSVIRQMLKNDQLYHGKFNNIILVSPSYAKMGLDDQVDPKNCNSAFSLDWIFNRIHDFNKEQLAAQKRVFNQLQNIDEQDKLMLDTYGTQSKGKFGIDCDQLVTAEMLTNRMYSSASRFFCSKDRVAVLPISSVNAQPSLLQRKKMQAAKNGSLNATEVTPHGTPQDNDKKLMQEYQKKLRELTPEQRESFYTNVLVILDDVVADIKKNETNPLLGKLIFNRRHIVHNGMVSIMLVSQKYTMIPARVRSNANWVISFKMNPLDQELIYRDVVHMPRPKWDEMLYFVFGDQEEVLDDQEYKAGIQGIIKHKRHDNIGVWVEYDLYFKNFKLIQPNT